ncbi:diguanylate cyclase [Pseudomonas sp. ML96]|uniref:GGDEF domain-containing protein n=1 Tax=Pseudomonas sp. ML96 TaxID=1523503 RepID=UPI000A3F449E|nr:GGDEF domain-containing protein [Pseudomonas sp. ML96]
MSPHSEWLDEVRPNPYAEQLSQGFRYLRFVPAIELEYRAHVLRESFHLRRVALLFAVSVWALFALADFWMLDAPVLYAALAIRLGVLGLLLVCGRLIINRRYPHLTASLSIACIGSMGLGAATIIALAHHQAADFPYEGLLLVCIAAYFLVGLRLSEALFTALLVVLVYGVLETLVGLAPERLFNNLLFLLVGNLIGAVGCYLLELKSREQFLVSRLMGLLVHRDSLTGLHNRRSFDRELPRLWRQGLREGRSIALLLCDVDHFKAYNDHYGHQAGDQALRQVGEVLQQGGRRPLDMAVRLGGEEFAVLLYDISPEEARQRAETLRQMLEERAIAHCGSPVAEVLTLSIGVACRPPTADEDPFGLCAHADRALYEAKAFGRNQVVT